MLWFKKKRRTTIEFDEILMDSSNLPSFNRARMEGRMELPIQRRSVFIVAGIFFSIATIFLGKIFWLQVVYGSEYRDRSDNNRLDAGVIIAERGVIYDRTGEMLAWNESSLSDKYDFPMRAYTDRAGLGQLLGYVSYPQKDSKGFYYRTDYIGRTGIESSYEELLHGENGKELVEVDALGNIISSSAVKAAKAGEAITTSVDAELSEAMYNIISSSTEIAGFRSGAGAIMDVETGEIIAMTSFPSYDPEVMADGDDVDLIEEYNNDDRFPFLNKVFGGAYTPGSIVKPIVAYAALVEDVIGVNDVIYSNGALTIPNRYNPDQPSRFGDWRAHGKMTMREAIAFSSDVYFYIIGGGLPSFAVPQAGLDHAMTGLGIERMDKYFSLFGLGQKTEIALPGEQGGTIPTPEWKQEHFEEDWLLGDTYLTAIGQFGFLTTPLQMLRAYAAIGNGGKLLDPHIIKDQTPEYIDLGLDQNSLKVIKEGMRMTVNYDGGTARGLEKKYVDVAAKSGTAELGVDKAHVNSWAAGFWPYEEPKYAFILLMDRAPRSNTLGATTIMGQVLDWINDNRPEYLLNEAVVDGD